MANSKKWLDMSLEERAAKRKEYQKRYKEKHPDKIKQSNQDYKERNKVNIRISASKWQKEKGRINKVKAIEYKGGMCEDCKGVFLPCCYDFHHIDPSIKDNTIARIMGREFENIKSELDKCVLLCANCHRIRHYNETL